MLRAKEAHVEAASVEDYLRLYYRKERMTPTLAESYREELALFGYVCTSRHDTVLGKFIAWSPDWSRVEGYEVPGQSPGQTKTSSEETA